MLGHEIEVSVLGITATNVRIGIDAGREVPIRRTEALDDGADAGPAED